MKVVSEEKSWLEWMVFGFSSILIVVLIGYLVRDALRDDGDPPDLRISLGEPQKTVHGFQVLVSVTNRGDQVARAVELEVFNDDQSREAATLTYDFISSGEVRKGYVGFSGQPSVKLSSRVVGYRTQ